MRIRLTCYLLLLITLPLILAGWLPDDEPADSYVVILGTKLNEDGTPSKLLQNRLDAAMSYEGQDVHYIVSGAGEAAVMKAYLIEKGIEEENILIEDQAANTYENIIFSADLLPDGLSSFTLISSDFHVYRAQAMASSLGYDVRVVSADTPFFDRLYWQVREVAALTKYWIIG
ncbi:MAG: YdcF family protein, partial [Lysinibacillus sp.]